MQPQNTQASIIIVADTLFFPPRRNGFSVRYYPLILELTKSGYLVDIIVVNKYRETYSRLDINKLKIICNKVDIIYLQKPPQSPIRKFIRRAINIRHMFLPFGIPYQLVNNNRDYIQDCINTLLKKRKTYDFGVGVGVGGCNADILLSLREETRPVSIICDFVDSAYLLRMRSQDSHMPFLKPITYIENMKTKRWEQSICDRCKCIYISDEDAKTAGGKNVHVIPNCVAEDGIAEASIINLESPNIAFLGNMSYPPNITACIYLISTLLPAIQNNIPTIHLYIVGRLPSNEILRYSHVPNIHITGEVANIWDYICSADAFVFPMLTGAGLQDKVLEAMYAGKPVITSPIGNEGIGARHGRDIYIANTVDEYAHFVDEAIYDGDRISDNARTFVQLHYTSRNLASNFEKLLCDRPCRDKA